MALRELSLFIEGEPTRMVENNFGIFVAASPSAWKKKRGPL